MSEFILQISIIATITLLGAMSPGSDFIVTVRNSVVHSRRAGLFTTLGISLGICVHMTYCILGIAALIAQSVMLFTLLKWLGAAYLVYVGFKALRSQGFENDSATGAGKKGRRPMSDFRAVRIGFLTNLLNPKATMFFFALFTQIINPGTPLNILLFYGVTVAITGQLWWIFVVLVLTARRIKGAFLRFSKWIDRLTGGLLIALGVRLAVSKA